MDILSKVLTGEVAEADFTEIPSINSIREMFSEDCSVEYDCGRTSITSDGVVYTVFSSHFTGLIAMDRYFDLIKEWHLMTRTVSSNILRLVGFKICRGYDQDFILISVQKKLKNIQQSEKKLLTALQACQLLKEYNRLKKLYSFTEICISSIDQFGITDTGSVCLAELISTENDLYTKPGKSSNPASLFCTRDPDQIEVDALKLLVISVLTGKRDTLSKADHLIGKILYQRNKVDFFCSLLPASLKASLAKILCEIIQSKSGKALLLKIRYEYYKSIIFT